MIPRTRSQIHFLLIHMGAYLRVPALVLTFAFPTLAAQTQQPPSQTSQQSSPDRKIITVWKVGGPYENGLPDKAISPDLKLSAEALGYEISIKTFRAVSFPDEFFSAFQKHQEPDILALENLGSISGITVRSGQYVEPPPGVRGLVMRTPAIITGIGSSEIVRRALEDVSGSLAGLQHFRRREYLIRTSRNYGAAKSLALRPPECGAGAGVQPLPEDLQTLIAPVIDAYLGGTSAIKSFEDADRLRTPLTSPWQSQVGKTNVCRYWGSDHLAFVQTVSTYESVDSLGWLTVLLIFRKQESKWGLLVASTDPVCNAEFVKQLPKIIPLIAQSWTPDRQPMPAKLLTPEGGKNLTSTGKRIRGFRWQPSGSDDVVAEFIEFARNDDARLFASLRSRDHSLPAQIPAEKLPMTGGQWRWRVWSISESGAVAFSASRSFSY